MNAVADSSPHPLQISGLHHVAIIASDYARSRHFYTQVLGLPVVHEMYRAERQSYKLDLQLPDGTQLELFSFPSPPPRPSYPEACGLRHLALRVADMDASVAWLMRFGEPHRTVGGRKSLRLHEGTIRGAFAGKSANLGG